MQAQWSLSTLAHLALHAGANAAHIEGITLDSGLRVNPGRLRREDDAVMLMMGLAGSWCRSGVPLVRPTLGALRRFTRSAPERKPIEPWRAWVIELFRDQWDIMLITRDGNADPIKLVLVLCIEGYWSFFALGARVEYMFIGRTAEQMRDGWNDGLNCVPEPHRVAETDLDRTSVGKLRYLVLGAAAALGEIDGVQRVGAERAAQDVGRYPAGDYALT